jgi:glutaredoxin
MPMPAPTRLVHALPLLLLVAAQSGHAQYKVVAPDGRVTYTDRPPLEAQSRVTALGARAPTPVAEVALPAELRQAVSRYPATLYVSTGGCGPCDGARQLLRGRGVPFSEKLLLTREDAEAFEKISGSKEVPVLTLGGQTLRGYAPEIWTSYLDAAGYPRDSRLPAAYQYPPATPLVERRVAPAPAPTPVAADTDAPAAAAPRGAAEPPPPIRF